MQSSTPYRIRLGGRTVECRVVRSKGGRKLRVRVGPNGVEVIQPSTRNGEDLSEFLAKNGDWIVHQLDRAENLRRLRRPFRRPGGEILYRGETTPVRIERNATRATGNTVRLLGGELIVSLGPRSETAPARSLELWLRRQARSEIERQLQPITARLGHRPERVYVMGQRTKWGNCSSRRNLSFNWRLILAPDCVLRYLVTHEAVHLVVPDHSARFWLTVQSVCRETEKAKQWLCRHHAQLHVDLHDVLKASSGGGIPTACS
jgi:predicted metal-dependent hydrolase